MTTKRFVMRKTLIGTNTIITLQTKKVLHTLTITMQFTLLINKS